MAAGFGRSHNTNDNPLKNPKSPKAPENMGVAWPMANMGNMGGLAIVHGGMGQRQPCAAIVRRRVCAAEEAAADLRDP
jgi:hypothetical protein